MTREEAINILNALKFILNNEQYTGEIEEALDIAIEALQQPNQFADGDKKEDHFREVTKKVDVISRQAAIARAVPLNLFGREVMMVSVSELENLPSAQLEQRWIPVTERLPKEDHWLGGSGRQFSDEVLVSVTNYDDEDIWTYISQTIDGEWALELPNHCKIIAWMPLPAPYQKEGEKDE